MAGKSRIEIYERKLRVRGWSAAGLSIKEIAAKENVPVCVIRYDLSRSYWPKPNPPLSAYEREKRYILKHPERVKRQNARNNQKLAESHAQRKAQGLCVLCGSPSRPGKVYCRKCSVRTTDAVLKFLLKNKSPIPYSPGAEHSPRSAEIIDTIKDAFGDLWDVRERRATSHGFVLEFGWPSGAPRGRGGCGGPRLIPTRPLISWWKRHRLERDGSNFNLPASRTALKKLRHILGFDFYQDYAHFWIQHLDDMMQLSEAAFARKYTLQPSKVSEMRIRLFGRKLRLNGWWREDTAHSLLISDLPHAFVAEKLSISIGASSRLRSLLKRGLL